MKLRFVLLLLLTAVACSPPPAPPAYGELDIPTIQRMMDQGELTSESLTDYYLRRIEAVDSGPEGLNSIIEINPEALRIARALDAERAGNESRGPMHGIPVVLKANIDTADQMDTTAGSIALLGHRPDNDAFLVSRLRDAGAVIIAKANLSEWANFRSTKSTSGWSSIGGQTRNAYDPLRNPCGSSSGSAVAVAANLASVAVGTETDGSIVCPSSANGIVGVKPSLGLVSRSGIIPIAHSQDTAGPMARTVMDAAILMNALVARDENDPMAAEFPSQAIDFAEGLTPESLDGARIGVIRNYNGVGEDLRVDAIFEQSIKRIGELGAEIIDNIELDTEGMRAAEYEVLLYEFKAGLNAYFENSGAPIRDLDALIEFNTRHADRAMPVFGQEILEQANAKGPLSDPAYLEALATSKRIARGAIDSALAAHKLDALVVPTLGPTGMIDHVNGDQWNGAYSAPFAAISGYASVTVPSGYVGGLPVGLSFVGGALSDHLLIRYAYAFEQATKVRRSPGLSLQ